MGKAFAPFRPPRAIERPLAGDFADQSVHPQAFCDQARAGLMHGCQKVLAGIVDTGNVSDVDFDCIGRALSRTPGGFGFINPGAAKSSHEFEATLPAFLM